MFDYHAHIGRPTDNALVCTSKPGEEVQLSPFRHRSIGLLPPYTEGLERMEEYAEMGYAVGEIGLDRRFGDREKQMEVFRTALGIAVRHHSLVTIHCVGMLDVMLSILREYRPERFIFHSFTSSPEIAHEIEKLGGYISISPVSVKSRHFRDVITSTRSFLIETDMPTGPEEERTLAALYAFLCRTLDRELSFPAIL